VDDLCGEFVTPCRVTDDRLKVSDVLPSGRVVIGGQSKPTPIAESANSASSVQSRNRFHHSRLIESGSIGDSLGSVLCHVACSLASVASGANVDYRGSGIGRTPESLENGVGEVASVAEYVEVRVPLACGFRPDDFEEGDSTSDKGSPVRHS
jgi:hypothetical protein